MSTCVCYETCIDDMLDDLRSANATDAWLNNSQMANGSDLERKLGDAVAYQNNINEYELVSELRFVQFPKNCCLLKASQENC